MVARGDGQYARNLFYLEENSRETDIKDMVTYLILLVLEM